MSVLLAYPLLFGSGAATVLGSIYYNYINSSMSEDPILRTPSLTPHSMAILPTNKYIITKTLTPHSMAPLSDNKEINMDSIHLLDNSFTYETIE